MKSADNLFDKHRPSFFIGRSSHSSFLRNSVQVELPQPKYTITTMHYAPLARGRLRLRLGRGSTVEAGGSVK